VFYNVRGRGKTAKAAAELDGESRYLSDVGKGAAGRPCWNVLELFVCNAETVGHGMITPANFQRPYLLQNINNNQPGGTWGFA
jgi:hypothetical protein